MWPIDRLTTQRTTNEQNGPVKPPRKPLMQTIEEFHQAYREICPEASPLTDAGPIGDQSDRRKRLWQQLAIAGHTLEQVKFVLAYLAHGVRNRGWSERRLDLVNICDCEKFRTDLDLGHWLASKRPKASPPRPEAQLAHGKWEKPKPEVDVKTSMRLVPDLIKAMRKELQ